MIWLLIFIFSDVGRFCGFTVFQIFFAHCWVFAILCFSIAIFSVLFSKFHIFSWIHIFKAYIFGFFPLFSNFIFSEGFITHRIAISRTSPLSTFASLNHGKLNPMDALGLTSGVPSRGRCVGVPAAPPLWPTHCRDTPARGWRG